MILDPLAGDKGFYGRLLAHILVDGRDFNTELVEQGYARVYTEGDSSGEKEYLDLQLQAQAESAGLWQCAAATLVLTPTPPTLAQTGQQAVVECVFYDGLVRRTEADEYVQIANMGDTSADLSGWRLVDIAEGSPSFTFPSYVLDPGDRLRVYTNEHHPESGGFTFGYGRAVWNNREPDVAALFDSTSREVSRKSYPPGC